MTTTARGRTAARIEFLANVLTTAIENTGYGQFWTHEYPDLPDEADLYADIEFYDDEGTHHRVDLDVIARGFGIIRNAVRKVDAQYPNDGQVFHNATTGQRLYMGETMRDNLLLADRTNGDEGEFDVFDGLAVLECALLGAVTYG